MSQYTVLCISEDSIDQSIKSAYRRLSLKLHPDKNRDCSVEEQRALSDKFCLVSNAFEVLGSVPSRTVYDHHLQSLRLTVAITSSKHPDHARSRACGDVDSA